MKNFNECINEVRSRIENLDNGYKTSQEQRCRRLSDVMNNPDNNIIPIYAETPENISEEMIERLNMYLEAGVHNVGPLAIDVEIEKALSFKDTYGKLDYIRGRLTDIKTEIQRAYNTVLFMLGYDCIKASTLGFEPLRALTMTAVISEFLHELFTMADAWPREELHFVYGDDKSKLIYLPDINGVMDMILDAYEAKH